jgi:hypothetical protein
MTRYVKLLAELKTIWTKHRATDVSYPLQLWQRRAGNIGGWFAIFNLSRILQYDSGRCNNTIGTMRSHNVAISSPKCAKQKWNLNFGAKKIFLSKNLSNCFVLCEIKSTIMQAEDKISNKLTIDKLDLKDKRVLMRVDFNVSPHRKLRSLSVCRPFSYLIVFGMWWIIHHTLSPHVAHQIRTPRNFHTKIGWRKLLYFDNHCFLIRFLLRTRRSATLNESLQRSRPFNMLSTMVRTSAWISCRFPPSPRDLTLFHSTISINRCQMCHFDVASWSSRWKSPA